MLVCLHCTCILWKMPCLLTCVLWMMSYLYNCVLWVVSCLCACVLRIVSHWFPCVLLIVSCRFTCVWLMTGWDVLEGRSGGTWLPGEFLAPLSWKRHSNAQIGKKRPGHSEKVKGSIFGKWNNKKSNPINLKTTFNKIGHLYLIWTFLNNWCVFNVFQIRTEQFIRK